MEGAYDGFASAVAALGRPRAPPTEAPMITSTTITKTTMKVRSFIPKMMRGGLWLTGSWPGAVCVDEPGVHLWNGEACTTGYLSDHGRAFSSYSRPAAGATSGAL